MRLPAWTIPGHAMACLAMLLHALPTQAIAAPATTSDAAGTAADAWPAARRHVRILDGLPCKFTSRLSRVVELNFTFGEGHQPGKAILAASLDRIAINYGGAGAEAFSVRHLRQGTDGGTGTHPAFTLEDLLEGEVLVANNLSKLGSSGMPKEKQEAIRRAIEVEGRGYLAFHGSGDNDMTGWPWLNTTLHPLIYRGKNARISAPVYKHLAESRHVVLQGILEKNTAPATVPDELDSLGGEALAEDIPTRLMKSEWFRWGRDISRDSAYLDKVTILLKYDPRNLGAVLEEQYRRKGGNMFTWLYRVGAGMTSYVQPGHENDELLDPRTGFDGGVGDFDRYVAQTLFFLAGYDTTACDTSCHGLPVVDANNRLTGQSYQPAANAARESSTHELRFDPVKPAFSHSGPEAYLAVLRDGSGRTLSRAAGRGPARHDFDLSLPGPGVYALTVGLAGRAPRTRLYARLTQGR